MQCDLLNEVDLCLWNTLVIAFGFGKKIMSSNGNLIPLQPSPGTGHVLLPSMADSRLVLGTAWLSSCKPDTIKSFFQTTGQRHMGVERKKLQTY